MIKNRAMQQQTTARDSSRNLARKAGWLGGVVLLVGISGCGGNVTSNATTAATSAPASAAPKQGPQLYFAVSAAGATNDVNGVPSPLETEGNQLYETYAIDDSADAFSQSIYLLAPQVINAGTTSALSRGLLGLDIMENYSATGVSSTATYVPMPVLQPNMGESFAVELAGQAGGLMQLVGQPVAPLVAATQCPTQATPQTYQFLTIPNALPSPNQGSNPTWNPATQTAYGSVAISSSGSNITFNNVQQFTLPSAGGTAAPSMPSTVPSSGACGPTNFGNTISAPGQFAITTPSSTGQQTVLTPATIGIGPTGLLVEEEGVAPVGSGANSSSQQVGFAAGTGAVGLPEPSSPLNVSAVVGAQYLGFVYGAGVFVTNGAPANWTSHLASFGFPSVPSSCASVATPTSTLIYGGDFINDDPTTGTNGFGNCDLAIDLGPQAANNNGLYSQATVWIGGASGESYAGNTMGKSYSFPAVAIAGQLNGKYAIFVLGVDSTQPWAIYLLQSN
jgi:hypothetical protein